MPQPPAPYITKEPWLPFTPRERPRATPLRACPSDKCRRAKACVDAHDKLYCQRTHEAAVRPPALRPGPAPHYSDAQLELLRDRAEQHIADIAIRKREMLAKWKAGVFDDLYGKYKPHGVWKHPPQRQYTEG